MTNVTKVAYKGMGRKGLKKIKPLVRLSFLFKKRADGIVQCHIIMCNRPKGHSQLLLRSSRYLRASFQKSMRHTFKNFNLIPHIDKAIQIHFVANLQANCSFNCILKPLNRCAVQTYPCIPPTKNRNKKKDE
ncbi:hypothetical protein CHUAL_004050 [Chamberlinius hualienensis]